MEFRFILALMAGKITIKLCRLFNLGGTTLPGKIALKIFPSILTRLSKDCRIILVTGTNGKTTTSRIISRILDDNGIRHMANKSGANLLSGVTSAFIEATSFGGRRYYDTALLEVDEAAVNVICVHIKPDIVVVSNFFRDQLDRYGEMYTTVANVRAAIARHEDSMVILNADDSLCASLSTLPAKRIIYYGLNECGSDDTLNAQSVNSDARFCIHCKTEYTYDYKIYGHLGAFRCPGCGFARPSPDIVCALVSQRGDDGSDILIGFKESEQTLPARVALPGLYNIYNAMAAFTVSFALGLPPERCVPAHASFECGFGRMETIRADNRIIQLILVKNPAGFDQVIDFLANSGNCLNIAFLLNDRIADGTDISWIWDVDMERLASPEVAVQTLFASGNRAEDMALRLKYAGLYQDKISINKDYDALLSDIISSVGEGQVIYILPTYTAMLDIRRKLRKRYKVREFWR